MQQAPLPPGASLADADLNKAIEVIQAQIAATKNEITQLTGQLTAGASHAKEQAISVQLDGANDRLEALQSQLDRAVSGSEAIAAPPANDAAIPRDVMNLIQMGLVALTIMVVARGIFRLIGLGMQRKVANAPEQDFSGRFDRLEQAMDAIAVEVERVSEGQRYTNKTVSELRGLPAPNPLEQWPAIAARAGEQVERPR